MCSNGHNFFTSIFFSKTSLVFLKDSILVTIKYNDSRLLVYPRKWNNFPGRRRSKTRKNVNFVTGYKCNGSRNMKIGGNERDRINTDVDMSNFRV